MGKNSESSLWWVEESIKNDETIAKYWLGENSTDFTGTYLMMCSGSMDKVKRFWKLLHLLNHLN